MTPFQEKRLSTLLERLAREGSVSQSGFHGIPLEPHALGLDVEAGRVHLPPGTTTLDSGRVRGALAAQAAAWLRDIKVFWAIDSTNSRMVRAAQERPVEGCCWLAELQTAGRGRRGRSWVSPFARNLTLSLGCSVGDAPRDAGALSLW